MNASIGDLAWLAGHWRGQDGNDIIEEHWSEPQAGTLMCMFRWIHDNKVRFFELVTIETDEDGQLRLRIKHFNPGLRGWEEKDELGDLHAGKHRRPVGYLRARHSRWTDVDGLPPRR